MRLLLLSCVLFILSVQVGTTQNCANENGTWLCYESDNSPNPPYANTDNQTILVGDSWSKWFELRNRKNPCGQTLNGVATCNAVNYYLSVYSVRYNDANGAIVPSSNYNISNGNAFTINKNTIGYANITGTFSQPGVYFVQFDIKHSNGNALPVPSGGIRLNGKVTVNPAPAPVVTRVISIQNAPINFNDTQVGSSSTQTLQIKNTGNSTLNITSITFPNSVFTGTWSGNIPAGQTQNIPLTFTPTSAITYTGTATVNSNKTSGTNTFTITGKGTNLPNYTISGRVKDASNNGIVGADVGGVITDANGNYSILINSGYSGTVTPSYSPNIYSFSPASRTYNNITSNQTNQDYTVSLISPTTGCVNVTLNMGRWNVDGGAWQNNGATVCGLSTGNHTIDFEGVPCYATPNSQMVNITGGNTTNANATYTESSPNITLTSPNGGEVWTGTQTYNITWTSSCLPSSCGVYILLIVDEGLATFQTFVLAQNASNNGIFSWTPPNTINSPNCQILVYPNNCGMPYTIQDRSNSNFTIKPNCTLTCIPASTRPIFYESACGLVNRGILCYANTGSDACLTAGNCIIQPNGDLTRQQWANMLFRAKFGAGYNPDNLIIKDFPTPFDELVTNSSDLEQKFSKALCYLEYGDGVPVFRRRFNGFDAGGKIKIKFVLKALLEAFNISPDYSSTLYGMCEQDGMRGYVKQANDMGLIPLPDMTTNEATPLSSFDPEANCTRREAIILLYRLVRQVEQGLAISFNPLSNQENSFYRPANYQIKNLKGKGGQEGNMTFYTESPFVIPGTMPLNFGFTYNSQYTELPGEFLEYQHQPMGLGFSHTYHIYMIEYRHTYQGVGFNYYLIKWADGTIWTFLKIDGQPIQTLTQGLYDTKLEAVAPTNTTFRLRTKDQTLFTFEKKPNGSAYLLTDIKDRHNNSLQVQYTSKSDNGCNNNELVYMVSRVEITYQPSGSVRGLNFDYQKTNGAWLLSKVTAPYKVGESRNIQFEYNSICRLYKFIDAKNNATEYFYGKPTDELLWDNNAPYAGDYPPFHAQLKEIKRPRGNRIKAKYVKGGVLNQITSLSLNGAQPNETINFNISRDFNNSSANGFTGATVTQGNNTSVTKYNDKGLPAQMITDVVAGSTSTTDVSYDNAAHPFLPSSMTQDGTTINYEYDDNGNPKTATLPLGIVHRWVFNATNDLESYTNPRNLTTSCQRNANGVVTKIIPPEQGTESTFTPNANGTIANTTVGGVTMNMDYNDYGNLTRVSNGAFGDLMTMDYYYASQTKSITNALGQKRTMDFDKNDNQIFDQFENIRLEFTTDENDNLRTTKNPEGGVTTTTPNDFDLLQSTTFAGKTQSFAYRPEDLLLDTWTKQDGTQVKYAYEAKSKRFQGVLGYMGIIYYNAGIHKGRIKTIAYKDNLNATHTLEFNYDAVGRLENYTFDNVETVGYEYADKMNLTKITYPDGNFVAYTYDNNNRLKKVLWNGTQTVIEYFYEGIFLKYALYGNGTRADYTYNDPLKRLTGISYRPNADANSTPFAFFQFELDKVGRHTQEDYRHPLGFIDKPADNGATTYETGGTNRLTAHAGLSFGYDANNQINSKGAGTPQATAFGYHPITDRPTSLTTTTNTVQYEQDALGNLRQATRNGIVTKYSIDLSGLGNILTEETAGQKRYYIYGMGMVARVVNGQLQYYHSDFRGSTIAITNQAKQITHSYAYGEWGELLKAVENGADVTQSNQSDNRFRFVGRYGVIHEIYEFYLMRARMYDSQIGRFTGEDKIWGKNLFSYSSEDPISFIDQSGEYTILAGAALSVVSGYVTAKILGNNYGLNDVLIDGTGGIINTVGEPLSTITKAGSNTWGATRSWLGRNAFAGTGQDVHHWLFYRNEGLGRYIPEVIKNQPWNLMPMPSNEIHQQIHKSLWGRLQHGIPKWVVLSIIFPVLRQIEIYLSKEDDKAEKPSFIGGGGTFGGAGAGD